MPQLDITTFSSQLFWLGLSFIILYLILSYVAVPKIARIYDDRQKTVEEKLSQANSYREKAEELLAEYEATLASARGEAHEQYRAITHAVTEEMLLKQQTFLDALNVRLHLEEKKLSHEALDVREDMQKAVLDIATALLKKLTGRSYTSQELVPFQRKA